MFNFTCYNCGSSKFGYQKWISSCLPVTIHDNNHMEYEEAIVNEDNELDGADWFICMDCGYELHLYGHRIQTEHDLESYLSMAPDEQKEQERLYQESEEETARNEEQREQDEIATYQTDE